MIVMVLLDSLTFATTTIETTIVISRFQTIIVGTHSESRDDGVDNKIKEGTINSFIEGSATMIIRLIKELSLQGWWLMNLKYTHLFRLILFLILCIHTNRSKSFIIEFVFMVYITTQ